MADDRSDLLLVAIGAQLVIERHNRRPDFGVDHCWQAGPEVRHADLERPNAANVTQRLVIT
jgi:hypothetical protein